MPHFRPAKPCSRDIEIYELVAIHNHPQREVADRYRISQGTVSRICRRVATWLTIDLPAHGTMGMAEVHLAKHNHRRRLEVSLARIAEAWRDSCQGEIQTVDGPGGHLVRRITKTSRPDVRLLREFRETSAALADAEEQEMRSRSAGHAFFCKQPEWAAQEHIDKLERICRLLRHEALRLRRAGVDIKLPRDSRLDRAAFILSAAQRCIPAAYDTQLPPAWQELKRQIDEHSTLLAPVFPKVRASLISENQPQLPAPE